MQTRITLDSQNASRLTLHNVRIAYAQDLNSPRAMQQNDGSAGTPRYSCVVMIPETAADVLQGINGVMWSQVQAKFGQKAQAVWQELTAANRLALKNGALKASKEGFAGNFFIAGSAKQDRPPRLYHKFLRADGKGPEELTRPQSVIYSGCYVNIQMSMWLQDNNYGKRVNADILAVQFASDGDAFGGGATGVDESVFTAEPAPSPFTAAPAAPAFPGMPAPQMPGMPGMRAPGGLDGL